jgi:hypothetical protein
VTSVGARTDDLNGVPWAFRNRDAWSVKEMRPDSFKRQPFMLGKPNQTLDMRCLPPRL